MTDRDVIKAFFMSGMLSVLLTIHLWDWIKKVLSWLAYKDDNFADDSQSATISEADDPR